MKTETPLRFEPLALLCGGWEFRYDQACWYVGAKHPNGGQKSFCDIRLPRCMGRDDFGNLFAAAPELLQALIDITGEYDGDGLRLSNLHEFMAKAKAAIAKATGRDGQ